MATRWRACELSDQDDLGRPLTEECDTTKKDTSVTFWAEQKKLCHAYGASMMIIVTKPGIIIDVVGSYFYDKKS